MCPETLIKALSALAVEFADHDLSDEQSVELEVALEGLMDQTADIEQMVVAQVLDNICDVDQASDLFLSELEVQSGMVLLGKDKRDAALLTCMPVTFLAGDPFRTLALSTDSMADLADVLTDAEVIGSQAQVAFLPRLFRADELVPQSYGTLRNVTRLLGEQILAGEPVWLEPGIWSENVPRSEKFAWGDNPYIELRFLIGIILTRETDLEDIFPAMGGPLPAVGMVEGDEAGPDVPEDAEESPGLLGKFSVTAAEAPIPWQADFLDCVDGAFFAMLGGQGVTLPDDFAGNLRQGLELCRLNGIQQQIRQVFDETETVNVAARPYCDQETGRLGWDLFLLDDEGIERDHGPWEVLLHEQPELSEESLRATCATEGWALVGFEPLVPQH